MGQKNNGNNKAGDGQNKEKGSSTFVFKFDCFCEGCAIKILKCIHQFQGVETVKTENAANKLTVIGAVDSAAIKEKLEKKTKKRVDLISPPPKKDDNKQDKKENKSDKDKNEASDNNNNKAEKKPKEVPVTTADLKVQLKCQCLGCVVKIRKIISDTKGVHELKVDKVKEVVTVKGTMDVKALAEALKDKLKKNVEIVPPKKEKDGKKEGGENGGGGGKNGGKKKNGGNAGAGDGGNGAKTGGGAGDGANTGGGAGDGGNGAKNGGGAGDGGNEAKPGGGGGGDGGGCKMEGNRMEVMVQPQFGYMPGYPGYGHPGYGYGYVQQHQQGHGYPGYGPGFPISVHPPHHMFNDENPNACAIM